MQRYKVKITDLAVEDFESICDKTLYFGSGVGLAILRMEGIRKVVRALQGFPERNELDDDPILADKGVRVGHYKDYNIYYVVNNEENTVYVLRIIQVLPGEVRQVFAFPNLQRISMEIFRDSRLSS